MVTLGRLKERLVISANVSHGILRKRRPRRGPGRLGLAPTDAPRRSPTATSFKSSGSPSRYSPPIGGRERLLPVALGAKRTSTGKQDGPVRSKMTQRGPYRHIF